MGAVALHQDCRPDTDHIYRADNGFDEMLVIWV